MLFLVACYNQAPEKSQAKIDYPPLTAKSDYEALQTISGLELNEKNSEYLLTHLVPRLLSLVETANQEADIVAVSALRKNPNFKPSSRSLNIVSAQNNRCDNPAEEFANTESLIWDDVNNDGRPLEGDKWFYILEDCRNEANGSTITGVYSFTGISDPFSELVDGENTQEPLFSDYRFKFDMQLAFKNGSLVYLENTVFNYERLYDEDENEITQLMVQSGSLMGGGSVDQQFLFKINEAQFSANYDAERLSVEINADYYERSNTLDGYINVQTEEALKIDYTQLNQQIINISVQSGTLLFTDQQGATLKIVIDAEQESAELFYDLDGDMEYELTDSVEKNQIINQGLLNLLVLTG